ncbi:nucleoside 2-deoxyribosyltransferase domain-containing protein [Actinopolyspora mortivallis]|uniref:Nucleoside 2-deoxyribosyltransferase n=1 Tax=Actinopolyspora mortivallis TaxID=33906 RepID=A0A2T0GSN3_ACTMO|nr:nucleoside 2-deoxyribosyltransferase domain-containing protein [Actinopolyspora mortivallis]PRW62128.1 hypothetical protein CEP50_17205 [Actinopolyspora mortivallis]
MRYLECPDTYEPHAGDGPLVFLAGGITGCPDWQREAVRGLSTTDWVVANPRRQNFPIGDPSAAETQIRWEHRHLTRADLVLFWFPASDAQVTTQPIALYELGAAAAGGRRLVVGAAPGYPRQTDVRLQLWLARPDVEVQSTLRATLAQARHAL